MKVTTLIIRWSLALFVCLGAFAAAGPAASARNDCKDRCKERYNLRKDICKAIPLKRQRHSCEDAAKHVRDECKHRCR
ncbi:MAG: hypothetical protein QOE96_324 [Blastocatellia bacterium]|jgi:hypothetical protein|nr:hypothetical protein [Blastocatellia bacterium]